MSFSDHRPSPDALLHPYVDITFKAMFTDKSFESKEALKGFLTDIIGRDIKEVSLIPNEPAAKRTQDKAIRFDVACVFNDGDEADIEMQGNNTDMMYDKRSEYLVARLLDQTVNRGDSYKGIKQVYQISVLNFIFDSDDSQAESWYVLRKQNGHTLGRVMNVIFIELPKVIKKEFPVEKLQGWEKWGIFIAEAGNPDKQDYVRKIAASNGGIMQAQKVLNKISAQDIAWKRELDRDILAMDEAEKLQAAKDREERGRKEGLQRGIQQGIQQGIQRGIEQGIQQGIQQTAKNMKNLGIDTATIEKATGLSENEILQL